MPQPWQTLAYLNAHPRDKSVRFVEKTHTYYINGSSKGYVSTTGFVHSFFPHFDADAVIKTMMASPNWSKSKYFGKTAEEIATEWSSSGAESSGKGTNMHLAIEQWLNGATNLIDATVLETKEWQYFQNFWRDYYDELEPYRMEWEVWDEKHKLSGSIDAIFRKKDGTYVIYDWKRSKEIKKKAYRGEAGYAPLDHLENVNYWHYTMQLNIYKWFLETHYGLKISGLYLIILHPNNTNYVRYELNILDDEVQSMLECRLAALEEGKGNTVVLPGEECLLED
jgi:ATP-dependent exoDNAse (exonuclease V) beta subunit